MSNKHTTQQHGCTTVNTTRPKSKLRKRANKHKSVALKMEIILKRREELKKLKTSPAGKPVATKPAPKAEKPAAAQKKTPAKKPTAKKPTPTKKAA